MFEEGDRVKFTNKGSWEDESNGAIGTVIGTTCYGAYVVEFDEPVSEIGTRLLCVCDEELTLIEEVK